MQKIVFYLKKLRVGGLEGSLFEYLEHIDKSRYNVTLLIGLKTYPLSPFLEREIPNLTIKYVIGSNEVKCLNSPRTKNSFKQRLIYNLYYRPLSKLCLKSRLLKLLQHYDCIIDYSLNLDYLVKKIKIKKIGFFHFRVSQHYTPNKVGKRLKKILPYYDHIVTLNQNMLFDAQQIFANCADKFTILHNQFNFSKIRQMADQAPHDTNLYNVDYIVSVGRLIENQKDFTTLINAYKILKDKYNRSEKLVIVGDGVDKEHLQNLASNLKLENDVYFAGYQTNPYGYIKNAKLFVLSSKHEGLPTVIIESMILNTPVISTNCPNGPSELLMEGKCGILVNVGDTEAMANSINMLLSDNKFKAELINNASQNLARFDIQTNINKLYELCKLPYH